jgi:hypothetical protein
MRKNCLIANRADSKFRRSLRRRHFLLLTAIWQRDGGRFQRGDAMIRIHVGEFDAIEKTLSNNLLSIDFLRFGLPSLPIGLS